MWLGWGAFVGTQYFAFAKHFGINHLRQMRVFFWRAVVSSLIFSPRSPLCALCSKMSVLIHSCHPVLFNHFEDCCCNFTWTGDWCSVIFRYTFSTWPQVLSSILHFIAFSASALSLGSSDISFDHGMSPAMKRHSWIAKWPNFAFFVQGRAIQFWTVHNEPAIWPNNT